MVDRARFFMVYGLSAMDFPPNRKNPKIFSRMQMSLRNVAGLLVVNANFALV